MKPFDPQVLRAKVAVFIELWQKTRRAQAARGAPARAGARRSSSARARCATARSPTRCRRSSGRRTPTGRRPTSTSAGTSTPGCRRELEPAAGASRRPPRGLPALRRAAGRGVAGRGRRSRPSTGCGRADGAYRWHLGRALPLRDDDGRDHRLGRHGDRHRGPQASPRSGSASSPRRAGCSAARSTTSRRSPTSRGSRCRAVADWCAVDLFVDGKLERLALEHATRSSSRSPASSQEPMLAAARRAGPPHVVARASRCSCRRSTTEALAAVALRRAPARDRPRRSRLRSYMRVPLVARDEVVRRRSRFVHGGVRPGLRRGRPRARPGARPPRGDGDRQRAPVRRRRSGAAGPRARSRPSATASCSSTATA